MSKALSTRQSNQRRGDPGVAISGELLEKNAAVGNNPFEAADRLGRELGSWHAPNRSADGAILGNKEVLDNRGIDTVNNDGGMTGASNTHKDTIVGAQYMLNCEPAYRTLGLDDVWADEFAEEVEEKFTLYAESDDHWVDVTRRNTLTDLVRLAVGVYFFGGEVVATMNWMRGDGRPYHTAMQMIDANRLCNPHGQQDTRTLRRGVVLDRNGAPIGYHFRKGHPRDTYDMADAYRWEYWRARKPWGRLQVLHILEQRRPDQNRGIADMVSILKESRMGKKFHEMQLQNAIVQATYAATIESDLPPEMAAEMIGAVEGGRAGAAVSYLEAIAAYHRGGRNIEIDGAKIAHLFPGTKLNMMSPDRPEGVGSDFEASLDRKISAGLGISYEEYTHDVSKTNYSSYRAAVNHTQRFMKSRKRNVADKTANGFYGCWLEEAISEGNLESMKSIIARNPDFFYEGQNKDALMRCTWIGSSRGQVDELKETQAAVMRINSGLSDYSTEVALFGKDYRRVFTQRAKEEKLRKEMGLEFNASPVKPGTLSSQRATAPANEEVDDGLND